MGVGLEVVLILAFIGLLGWEVRSTRRAIRRAKDKERGLS